MKNRYFGHFCVACHQNRCHKKPIAQLACDGQSDVCSTRDGKDMPGLFAHQPPQTSRPPPATCSNIDMRAWACRSLSALKPLRRHTLERAKHEHSTCGPIAQAAARRSQQCGHAEDDDGAPLQPCHQPVRRKLACHRGNKTEDEDHHAIIIPAHTPTLQQDYVRNEQHRQQGNSWRQKCTGSSSQNTAM